MSRVGNNPIPVPKGVEVKIGPAEVAVKGPLGSLARGLVDGALVAGLAEIAAAIRLLAGHNRVVAEGAGEYW